MKSKTAVLLPCYNEAQTIGKVTRDYGCDVIRVLGLWMILACHILSHFSFGLAAPMHDALAQCGNSLFFVLSGCLLGRKWVSGGCGACGWRFVGQRVLHLWPTFATFIVLYVVALKVCGHDLSVRQVVLNAAMLSWFAKMPAAGHLWFVTAILMFYVSLVGVSRIGSWARQRFWTATVASMALAMGAQCALWALGVRQSYLLPFLWGASFLFLFEDRIVPDRRLMCAAGCALPVCFLILGGGIPMFVQARCWVAMLAAFAVIVLVRGCRFEGRGAVASVVSWMAKVSFEVYLVHCIFIEDAIFPFRAFFGNDGLYALNYVVASFALACLLRQLASFLRRTCSAALLPLRQKRRA